MSALDLIDRYSSTVSSTYTSGGGTLVVTSGTGLPSGASNYYLTVSAEGGNTEEVFHVTSRSSGTLTVTGAQAGTSASNHAIGAVVQASNMTKDAYTQLKLDAATAAVKTAPTRVLNVVYQNTGTTPRMVSVVCSIDAAPGNIFALSDGFNPPTVPVFFSSSTGSGARASLFFIVPAGDYYEVVTDTTITVQKWNEYQ